MKSLINMALFKEQLKRFSPLMFVSILFYIFAVLLYVYAPASSDLGKLGKIEVLLSTLTSNNGLLLFFFVGIVAVTVGSLFSYLFTSKAVTTMHAYPFNKNQLFFTHALVGLLILVIPITLLSLALLNPVVMPSLSEGYQRDFFFPIDIFPNGFIVGEVVNTPAIVAGFFLRSLLTLLFYYALFLLTIMLVGNVIIYVLLAAALMALPTCAYVFFESIQVFFIFGYANHHFLNENSGLVLLYSNPAFWALSFTNEYWRWPSIYEPERMQNIFPALEYSKQLSLTVFYSVSTIVLSALALFAYHKRALEHAGDSVVFRSLTKLFIFLLSVAGMVVMALFLVSIFQSVVAFYIGLVLGFIIAYVIAQMIAMQSTNIFKKAIKELKYYGGIAILIYALLIVFLQIDIFGFSKRVPNFEDVASVALSPYGRFPQNNPDWNDDAVLISDPQFIAETLALHEEIINNRVDLHGLFFRKMGLGWNDWQIYHTVLLQYHLTDGTTITKQYRLPRTFIPQYQNQLLFHEKVLLNWDNSLFKVKEEHMDVLEVSLNNNMYFSEYSYSADANRIEITEKEEMLSFLDAFKQDYIILEEKAMRDFFSANELNAAESPNAKPIMGREERQDSFEVRIVDITDRPQSNNYFSIGYGVIDVENAPHVIQWLEENRSEIFVIAEER